MQCAKDENEASGGPGRRERGVRCLTGHWVVRPFLRRALKRIRPGADAHAMRQRRADRRMRRLMQLARWLETFWWCQCSYSNVATLRCYHCGRRPPRHLRARVAKQVDKVDA